MPLRVGKKVPLRRKVELVYEVRRGLWRYGGWGGVGPEHVADVFAIADAAETAVGLDLDDLADTVFFELAEAVGSVLLLMDGLALLQELGGPEQGAQVLCSEGWFAGRRRHVYEDADNRELSWTKQQELGTVWKDTEWL